MNRSGGPRSTVGLPGTGLSWSVEHTSDRPTVNTAGPADWPALALALQLECAIWTEDQDFFVTGVATWTTATVQRYFEN